MRRLLLILSGITLLVAFYYNLRDPEPVSVTSPEEEKITQSLPSKKSETFSETPVEPPVQPAHEEASLIDADRDFLLWRKLDAEAEEAWNKEIYAHIQYIDRDQADRLYRSFMRERAQFLEPQEVSLEDSLNELSRLNGESIDDSAKYQNMEMQHAEFVMKMQKLFGHHYHYIEDQRKIFLDARDS